MKDEDKNCNFSLSANLLTLQRRLFRSSPYSPDLAPSDVRLFCSLPNNLLLQNWLCEFFTSKPSNIFKCGIKKLPDYSEAIVNNGEDIISCVLPLYLLYLNNSTVN